MFPAVLRFLCTAGLYLTLGLVVGLGTRVLGDTAPAFVEGRLNGFADDPPAQVAALVERDWFADTGKSITSLGMVYNAYSPAADVFAVRVEGYRVRIEQVVLVCPGPALIEFAPADDTVAYLRQSPWPCETLIVALTRTDTEVTIVVTISLDGSPIPGRREDVEVA